MSVTIVMAVFCTSIQYHQQNKSATMAIATGAAVITKLLTMTTIIETDLEKREIALPFSG